MSALDGALRALGAQPGPFRALFTAQLKMDFRRASRFGGVLRQKEVALRTRMLFSFLLYGLMSLPVGLMAFACREPRSYAAMALGYALTMLGSMLAMEFGVSLTQDEDGAVLAHRPVSAPTYTLAKAANLAAFVGFYGIAVTGLPVVLAALAHGPAFGILLGAAIGCGTAALGGLILGAMGFLARHLDRERLRDALNAVTIAFSVAVPVGYLLLSRWADRIGGGFRLDLDAHPWMTALPPVWLAGAVETLRGSRDPVDLALALRAGALVAVGMACLGLTRRWAVGLQASGGAVRSGAGRRAAGMRWARPFLPTPAAWGIFRLLLAYLRRDRGTRARIYPQFGASLAIFVIAFLQGGMGDPWAGQRAGVMAFLAPAHLAMTCAWVPLLLRFSEQWEAAWILGASPQATLGELAAGLQRAVLVVLVAPAALLTWACFAILWKSPGHALLHILPPFLGAVTLMELSLLWRKPVPLSCRYVKGEAGTRMALTFTLMAAFAVLWGLQMLAAGSLPATAVLLGLCLTSVFAMHWVMAERLAGRPVVLADL